MTAPPTPNPVPQITGITPSAVLVGSPGIVLTVTGTGFVSGSVVTFRGTNRTPRDVTATQLTVDIPAPDLASAGPVQVTVINPPPGGTSNAATFTVNNPVPRIESIDPATALVGSREVVVTVKGNNFVSASVVRVNGEDRDTIPASPPTELRATIPAADLAAPGSVQVTVFNPTPGGGTSNAVVLSIDPPPPVPVGKLGGILLGVYMVFLPILLGYLVFALWPRTSANPVPGIVSITPSTVPAGSPELVLTVNGTGLVPASLVRVNGADRPTTFVSATRLTVRIPPSDLAISSAVLVMVFNPPPGGGTSGAVVLRVSERSAVTPPATPTVTPTMSPTPSDSSETNPVPRIESIDPTAVRAGSPGFVLTVNGAGFVPQKSVVKFKGKDQTPTTVISTTQLNVTIPNADVVDPGEVHVVVFNPSPGGGTSNGVFFIIAKKEKEDENQITLFWAIKFTPSADVRLILLVMAVGALGSYIHAATSFADFVGNRRLYRSWIWWYILRTFIGLSLALIFYFLIRGGLLSAGATAADISAFGIAAVAGLIGLFSYKAADKLAELFDTLFPTKEKRGDRLPDDPGQ